MKSSILSRHLPVYDMPSLAPNRRTYSLLEHTYIRTMNVMVIKGRSDENVEGTYEKALEQINHHFKTFDQESLDVFLGLSHFDMVTTKYLFSLVSLLNEFHRRGKKIKIFWSYKKNEDMIDVGLDLQEFCEFPFELVNV